MSRYEILQIILSALIFCVAVIGACIYGCQLVEMQKASKAAADSADAATKAANVAEQSLKMARETAHNDLRAWVVLQTVALESPVKVGEKPTVTIQFTNTGKTPGSNARLQAFFARLPANSPESSLPKPQTVSTSVAVIAPGLPIWHHLTFATELTDEIIRSFDDRETQLYVYGTITYDIINNEHGALDFCAVFNPAIANRISFDACPYGNQIR